MTQDPTQQGREEFEKWINGVHGLDVTWEDERNCYKEYRIHLAYKAWQARQPEIDALKKRVEELEGALNTPELHDFIKAVPLEAAHQRQRWGENHDAEKEQPDWFWLIGYVAGKGLSAWRDGNREKLKHHIITTAAVCANWHAQVLKEDVEIERADQWQPGRDRVSNALPSVASHE